jgi:lipopolysaccharide/colanic/teichoic acid biosynthesis glycosyltransferase
MKRVCHLGLHLAFLLQATSVVFVVVVIIIFLSRTGNLFYFALSILPI